MVTQVDRSICSSRAPSWCWVALVPVSAMKRNGEPSFRDAEPAAIELAFQNLAWVSFDCLKIFIWSSSLVMMMYHEPIDISDRMIRVARGTKPPAQTAEKPNGFSTSSLAPAGAAAGAGAAAASAAGAEAAGAAAASAAGAEAAGAAAASAALGASANAGADTSALAAVTENRTAARTADKRVFLNMLPPNILHLHPRLFRLAVGGARLEAAFADTHHSGFVQFTEAARLQDLRIGNAAIFGDQELQRHSTGLFVTQGGFGPLWFCARVEIGHCGDAHRVRVGCRCWRGGRGWGRLVQFVRQRLGGRRHGDGALLRRRLLHVHLDRRDERWRRGLHFRRRRRGRHFFRWGRRFLLNDLGLYCLSHLGDHALAKARNDPVSHQHVQENDNGDASDILLGLVIMREIHACFLQYQLFCSY